MNISLEPLTDTPANRARVQQVLEAAPAFSLLTESKLPQPDDAAELFMCITDGGSLEHKSVYMVRERTTEICAEGTSKQVFVDIGVVDIYRHWNAPNKALIGLLLLLLNESAQGRGIGSAALRLSLEEIRSWKIFDTVRIGVIENNASAFRFWRKHGFAENGEVKVSEDYVAPVVILERPLRD